MRLLVTGLLLALNSGIAAPLLAQGPGVNLKSIVDQGLDELSRRQLPDGSYDDNVVTTSQALLAFARSPRHYGEGDGPFFRRAVDWLATQIDASGRPVAAKQADARADAQAVAAARWVREALTGLRSAAAKGVLEKVEAFLASPAARGVGEGVLPDDAFTFEWRLKAAAVDEARSELANDLKVFVETRELHRADFDRFLQALPSLLADVAARFPALDLETTDSGRQHWTKVVSSALIGATKAPIGFEEATPRSLAATTRALTICMNAAPKEPGGVGQGPDKPKGTPRTVGADLSSSYAEAAAASLKYLEGQQKTGRFGFAGQDDPGITALALDAVIRTSHRLGQPLPKWVDGGLDWLVSLQKPNGSIHAGGLAVYVTSASVLALSDAGRAKDKPVLDKAATYLKVVQRDEQEGYDRKLDWAYGGVGYGDELRPDLSNTQFGVDALHAAGTPASDPAMQRAILFLQRCQNNPEANPTPIERADGRIVRSGDDGGGTYQPGESKAGLVDLKDGTFQARSYGSMTYALLKCYLFAGLSLEDPRVKTALGWIQKHWSVELNPGFDPQSAQGAEYQGLFYYYFTMAKALDAAGVETLTGDDGKPHAWREELTRKLLELSFTEGFWTNGKSARWMEEFPTLATSYALVALDHALPK